MTPAVALAETPLFERPLEQLLDEAVLFHGHLCPGQVLGARMVMAGCREVGIPFPRRAGKRLVVFVEIDRSHKASRHSAARAASRAGRRRFDSSRPLQ